MTLCCVEQGAICIGKQLRPHGKSCEEGRLNRLDQSPKPDKVPFPEIMVARCHAFEYTGLVFVDL